MIYIMRNIHCTLFIFWMDQTDSKQAFGQLEGYLLKITTLDHYHLVPTPASFFGLIDQC